MQIVDSNDFNLRTAVYLLARKEIEFVLIPVLHVGGEKFYEEVSAELDKCDVILFEGIGLSGLGGLWKAYRSFAKRLGLRYQADELDMAKYKGKLVHADYAGNKAEEEWKKIPWVPRIVFKTIYPLAYVFLSFNETKRSLAKSFRNKVDIDDQFWFMKIGKSNSIHNFITSKRDEVIKNRIDEQLANVSTGRVGVIYGAGHMKSVIEHLMRNHGFEIKNSWFMTVFWLTTNKFKYKRKEMSSP